MKNNLKYLSAFLITFLILLASNSIAQSDYQIVQNFKTKSAEIEKQIEADSQN
jgi:hypothetical protein